MTEEESSKKTLQVAVEERFVDELSGDVKSSLWKPNLIGGLLDAAAWGTTVYSPDLSPTKVVWPNLPLL